MEQLAANSVLCTSLRLMSRNIMKHPKRNLSKPGLTHLPPCRHSRLLSPRAAKDYAGAQAREIPRKTEWSKSLVTW